MAQGLSRHAVGCARVNRWTVLLMGVYIYCLEGSISSREYIRLVGLSVVGMDYMRFCDINGVGRTN